MCAGPGSPPLSTSGSQTMDKVILHTLALSPFGWGARLIAAEKGVEVELAPAEVSAPGYEALHPFRKMSVLRHGEVVVYESIAIAGYLDEAFPGPALRPAEPAGRAHVMGWLSVTGSYLFPIMNGLVKLLARDAQLAVVHRRHVRSTRLSGVAHITAKLVNELLEDLGIHPWITLAGVAHHLLLRWGRKEKHVPKLHRHGRNWV